LLLTATCLCIMAGLLRTFFILKCTAGESALLGDSPRSGKGDRGRRLADTPLPEPQLGEPLRHDPSRCADHGGGRAARFHARGEGPSAHPTLGKGRGVYVSYVYLYQRCDRTLMFAVCLPACSSPRVIHSLLSVLPRLYLLAHRYHVLTLRCFLTHAQLIFADEYDEFDAYVAENIDRITKRPPKEVFRHMTYDI